MNRTLNPIRLKLDARQLASLEKSLMPNGLWWVSLGKRKFGYVNRFGMGWLLRNPSHSDMLKLLKTLDLRRSLDKIKRGRRRTAGKRNTGGEHSPPVFF